MKPRIILVNAAQDAIVDGAVLVASFKSGHLGDVEIEPLTAEAGVILADTPNLILIPHIAGVTDEENTRVSHLTVENVQRVLGEV